MDKKQPSLIQLLTAATLAIIGMVLLFCGLYIDPAGEIHETVLVAFGEAATFAGSILGIDYHYKHRNNDHNNTDPQQTPG